MTTDDLDLLPPVPERTNEDMLRDLCREQQTKLVKVMQERDTLAAQLSDIGLSLIGESNRRKETLVQLGESLARMQRVNDRTTHERDICIEALRALCGHLANQPITSLTYFGGEAFAKSVREARELLATIDTARAARLAAGTD